MNPKKGLVLNDEKWEEIVKKSRSKYLPKNTVICPECIEELNEGPLRIEDLVHDGRAVPMNYWYMRKHQTGGLRYILSDIRYWLRNGMKKEEILDLWKSCS
jgi:hypothetical protein